MSPARCACHKPNVQRDADGDERCISCGREPRPDPKAEFYRMLLEDLQGRERFENEMREELRALRDEVRRNAAPTAPNADRVLTTSQVVRRFGRTSKTVRKHAERLGGWKVDPSKTNSEWNFLESRVTDEWGPPGGGRS